MLVIFLGDMLSETIQISNTTSGIIGITSFIYRNVVAFYEVMIFATQISGYSII